MSKPTTAIFPIQNGKLLGNLDANNLQIENLDTSNLDLSGGSGIDTGTSTAIIKGDGNHGIDEAIADVDYASVASVTAKEDSADHDTDIASITDSLASIETSLAAKASTAALTAGLALKTDELDFQAYIASNDAEVALKAYSSDVTTALSGKADTGAVTSALAGKEPLLPTTSVDGYILARHDAGAGSAWYFVDPLTLGTTSQTFDDGVENSTTTFTSASANFVANDVGKAITGADIPSGTTIASRTNSTTVILSAAATATATGVTFTIVNRVEIGGSGTVTSVGVTNNATVLFSTSVANASTTPVITINPSTTVGANTFYGNATGFSGTAGFMSASAARAALGGTTIGQAFFMLTNPSQIGFVRTNADNTVTARSIAQTLTDLGAETALTFTTPLARSTNTISIPAATDIVAGHLTATDHATFAAKVGPTRTISTTAPLTGGGDFSANRTIAMPAATSGVDGYMTSAAFADFTNKPPNTRTISTTAPLTGGGDLSANRTIAIPRATSSVDGYMAASDFASIKNTLGSFSTAGTGGTLTISDVQPPVTKILLNAVLTSTLNVNLPTALNYTAGGFIEFIDTASGVGGAATANFGITLNRVSTDLVDNTPSVSLPRGIGYLRVNSNGVNRWTTTKYFVDSFKDGTNPTKTVTLDVTQQTAGVPGTLTLANGASVTVKPTDVNPQAGVVIDISSTGVVSKGQLNPTDLIPQEYTVGQAGFVISSGSIITVTNSGGIDTVRVAGTLGGPISIRWPNASLYSSGEAVTLFDASGSLSADNAITISNTSGHTFNGNPSFIFDEPNGRKVLTSDGVSNWAVSLVKTSIQPFRVATAVNGTFTLALDANVVKQNYHLTLGNGQNTLALNGARDGMELELVLVQPSSGAAGTLSLPIGSYVAGNGLGAISLTATNSAIDRLRGVYDGTIGAFLWQVPIANHTSAALPNAPSALATSGITSAKVDLTWTDNATNETGFEVHRAPGTSGTAFVLLATLPANTVAYTDNGVAAGTGYNYKVRAFNAGGFSSFSSAASATTSAGGPTADIWEVHFNEGTGTTANATIPVGGTVDLVYADWTASTQASAFAFNPSAGMALTTGLAISNQGTGGAITYSYRVAAFKNSGATHNAASQVTTNTGNATLGAVNFNRISWTAVTGAEYYVVYRTASGGSPSTLGALVGTGSGFTSTTFDDTGVATSGITPPTINVSTDGHTATAHPPSLTHGTNQLSVAFWVKGTFTATGTLGIVGANQGGSNWRVNYIAGNKFQIAYPGATGSVTATVPNTAVNNGAWHHVAITIDNSTTTATTTDVKVYYDGSSTPQTTTLTTNTKSGALIFPAYSPQIGGTDSAFAIDDVRIYSTILSTAQIGALFTGNAQ